MKNYIQEGEVLNYTVPAATDIVSGDVVIAGKFAGIAAKSGSEGDVIPVNLEGVFEVGKTAALAITQGDTLFFNTGTKLVTKTVSDKRIGIAFEDADGSASTCLVKISEEGSAGNIAANVAAEATANGSDAATTQALANALKTKVNAILTALKAGGVMVAD